MLSILPSHYLASLIGGGLIGFSASILFLINGRIAGISGIVGALFKKPDAGLFTNAAFMLGLVFGPVLFLLLFKTWPVVHIQGSSPLLIVAGLLVGFGTRMGSGCTSGHGVAGLARLSPRSIAAVATFLLMGILTVFLMRVGGVA